MQNKNELPVVSIMIATFNSSKLLKRTLEAIRNQTYPQEKIEILIMDGGSSDNTLEMAEEFGCKILINTKTDPINAKILGYENATGDYLMTIDHDEVLTNARAIEHRVAAFKENPDCKAAIGSGYLRPSDYSKLSQYISDFGDPFSLFIYNFPKCHGFQEKKLRKYYHVDDHKTYMVVDFHSTNKQPLFELACGSNMLDLNYFRALIGNDLDTQLLGHLFFMMLEDDHAKVIVMKHDPLAHYSADAIKAYYPKLKWRICNNVHFQDVQSAGFSGRTAYQKSIKYKSLLFVPYTVSTIIPFLHGVCLALSRRNSIYLMHVIFCWYVLLQIVWQYTLKLTGHKPKQKSYDGKKTIE